MKVLLIALLLIPTMGFSHKNTYRNPFMAEEPTLKASIKLANYYWSMSALRRMEIDVAGVDIRNRIADVLVSQSEYHMLTKMGFNLQIMEAIGVSRAARIDQKFKNPDEIEKFLKAVAARYPQLTKLFVIGQSSEGRNIYALKISDNPELDERDEPAILFNSMHHSREIMTPELSIDIIETLISNAIRGHRTVSQWVRDNEIWVVPMLNVDGSAKVWSGRSMWRKNTFGGHGVDLNRNYPTEWGACRGSSGNKRSDTYRGASPGSESETKALMGLVKKIRPVFNISFHSYSEMVIYPKGCRGQRTETADVVEKIGKQMGQMIGYAAGTGWELLYPVDGSDIDWMYEAMQVIPYVFEVNSRSVGFHPDYDKWRDKTVAKNRPAWQFLLKRLESSGIRGYVARRSSGDPVPYQIEIRKGSSATGALHYTYRGNPDGSYFLILNPGTYHLSFKIDGAADRVQVVKVGNSQERLSFDI